ncbi:phospholipid transporting ATPase, partial [Spiromyces aspiralis]
TLEDLETFATNGFRTLCLAYRVLGEDEYAAWNDEFQVACASLGDREAEIEAVCENIEHSLKLVGGSAIEDKLQVGVPETIAQLALAGVKLWVLTGDKTETAINIGYSCNLLREDMTLINIQAESAEDTENQLLRALDLYGDAAGAVYDRGAGEAKKRGGRLGKFCSRVGLGRADTESCSALIVGKNGGGRRLLPGNLSSPRPLAEEDSVSRPTGSGKGHGRPLALVIDGASLKFALEPSLSELLLALTRSCDSVICCRVSPLQKALVVKLIKDGLGCLTLAIGDGANDVSMIQTADIGIGISGEEGLQAVMASDYAISQFRFLQTLLLVHGRWSYTRISTMIVNFFYKNVVWTVGLFWYQIFCGWSVTNFYDYALINFYNMLFTSLPPGVLGVFDHDLPAYVVKTVPQLYRRGIQHLEFSTTRFWMYILDGMYQSVVIVFITAYSYQVASTAHRNGRDDASRDDIGTVAALSTVIIVNAYMGLNTRTWGLAMPAAIAIGLGCFFAIFFIYAGLSGINFSQGAARRIFTQLDTYLIILLTFVLALIPRYSTKFYKSVWRPTDADIVREIVKTKRPRRVPREQQVTMLTEYLDRISAGKVGEAGDVGAPLEGGDMAANTGPFDPEKRSPGRVEREGEARNAGPQGEDDRDHISMLRRISMMQSPHYRAQQLKRQLSRRSTGRSTTEQGMGNMPGGSSSGGVRVSRAHTHRSSIIHMGDGFAYSNTGFAYSHDDNSSLHRFGTRKGFWSRLIPKKKSHQ